MHQIYIQMYWLVLVFQLLEPKLDNQLWCKCLSYVAVCVSLHTPSSRLFPNAALFVGRKFLAVSAKDNGTGEISWHNNVLRSRSRPASAATRSLWKCLVCWHYLIRFVVSFTFTTVYIVLRLRHGDCFSFVWNPTSLVHNRLHTNSVSLSSPCIWAVNNAVLMFSLAMSPTSVRSWVFVLNTENLHSWSTSFWISYLSLLILEVPMSVLAEGAYSVWLCLLWPRQTWQRPHQQGGYGHCMSSTICPWQCLTW